VSLLKAKFNRRDFLKFLGVNLGLSAFYLSGCNKAIEKLDLSNKFQFKPIEASKLDELILPDGFAYDIIRSWKDPINSTRLFGTSNDFTAFFELDSKTALLWVNHELVDPKLIPDITEQKGSVGGSVIALEKKKNKWQFSQDKKLQDKYNRRYDANSPMKYTGEAAIKLAGGKGTLANCSGGVTPWKTVLSCEENFDYCPDRFGWKNFNREEYGWVVEIDPYDKNKIPMKHTALGRFAHENAAVSSAVDKALVVYMGDDTENEHIYKYVSNSVYKGEKSASHLLQSGKLYVAKLDEKTKTGRWQLLDINETKLKGKFSNQAELLINTRKAAKLLNATELNRPEDIEISPYDGSIFVAQSMNKSKDDLYGSILKIEEKDSNYEALEFKYEHFLIGGEESGLACPDNLCFDNKGNLWVATDVYGIDFYKNGFAFQANNALYVIPLYGDDAGIPKRFASAPKGAEITGPSFSSDYKTLFLSIQHPGEYVDSKWPNNSAVPKSSVVAINLV
jgi:uncharacterized protein